MVDSTVALHYYIYAAINAFKTYINQLLADSDIYEKFTHKACDEEREQQSLLAI